MHKPRAGHFGLLWLPALAILVLSTGVALAMAAHAGNLPLALAIGVACLAGACLAIRVRAGTAESENRISELERRLETLQDHAWELRESEERYRSLAEAFDDLVMVRDSGSEVLFVNEPLARMLGRPAGEIVGTRFTPEFRDSPALTVHPAIPRAREVMMETAVGPRWFQWIDMPVRDERTGRAATRSVARDITDHKRVEQALENSREKAEQANRAKSRFLGMVSHEMRTPLNGILGMAGLISQTELTPEQRSYADAIRSSGDALLSLIEDLLDLTLIEADRFELKPQDTDARQLVEEVCELLAPRTREKGIELAAVIDPAVPDLVSTDKGRLRQVLVNLIGNAIKFTEKGGIRVGVTRLDNERLAFSVRDTGPGLDAPDIDRIFREFEQADGATTRRHGGAGLGLSISQRIVKRLGGEISVDTSPGEGATFEFVIPAPVRRRAPADAGDALAGQSVLLVSRGKIETNAIAESVRMCAGQATVCEKLGDAARLLREHERSGNPFDTLVMDPKISRDPVRSLARLKGAARNAPHSIVLVDPGMREQRERYLAEGFDGFLVRPVRHGSLIRVLGERRDLSQEYERASGPRDHALARAKKLPPMEILLAEDNEINALLARSILEKMGQRVTQVDNGRRAVAAYRDRAFSENRFDMVLMDLHMPVLDGASAIAEIRKLEKRRNCPPAHILVLTADEQASSREEIMRVGADGYVTKPIEPADLISRLQALAGSGRKRGGISRRAS